MATVAMSAVVIGERGSVVGSIRKLQVSCRKRERDQHYPYRVFEITPPPTNLGIRCLPLVRAGIPFCGFGMDCLMTGNVRCCSNKSKWQALEGISSLPCNVTFCKILEATRLASRCRTSSKDRRRCMISSSYSKVPVVFEKATMLENLFLTR